jgi:hypothetical protein
MELGINNLLDYQPGIEAINFQGMSGLSRDLVALFQSVFDYKKSIEGENDITLKVLDFHEKNVPKKFASIVKKHTGLEVKSFTDSTTPSLGYACMLRFGSGDEGWRMAHDAIERYSNNKSEGWYKPATNEKETLEILKNIAGLIDDTTGHIKANHVTVNGRKIRLNYDVFFCPFSAYMGKESMHISVTPLVAAEVAAIMIHEIGHMMSLIEHAGDLIKRMDALETSLRKLDGEGTSAAAESEKASAIAKSIRKVKGGDKAETKHRRDVASSLENTAKLAKDSNIIERSLGVVMKLIGSVIGIAASTVFGIALIRPLMFVFGSTNDTMWKSFENKTGDFMKTFGDDSVCERYADEYVSRHGLGSAVVSGLAKLDSFIPAFYAGTEFRGSRESVLVYQIAKFEIFVSSLLMVGDDTGWGTYEPSMKRADRVMQNALKAFKNKNVHPDLQDYFLEDYERVRESAMDARRKHGVAGKMKRANVILAQSISISGLYKLLTTGNIDKRYQEMIDAVEEINASELNYHAAKLDQLGRKK